MVVTLCYFVISVGFNAAVKLSVGVLGLKVFSTISGYAPKFVGRHLIEFQIGNRNTLILFSLNVPEQILPYARKYICLIFSVCFLFI